MSHQTTIVKLHGSFHITPTKEGEAKGVMRVCDPCYTPDTVPNNTFQCLSGRWNALVEMFDEGNWGKRVGNLIIHHESMPFDSVAALDKSTIEVGVDSGQAGFYDESKYETIPPVDHDPNTNRYDEMCNLTLSHHQAGVFDCGVVSSSGFGDGSYELFLQLNSDGVAVAAKIEFIGDSNEDEEDTDYEDEEEEDTIDDEEDDS